MKKLLLVITFVFAVSIALNAQQKKGYVMTLNDNTAFIIKVENGKNIFTFNQSKDTLTFHLKPKMADKISVEVRTLKGGKVIYKTGKENLGEDKQSLIIPMADVFKASPGKGNLFLCIKEGKEEREKIEFNFQ